MTIKFKYGKDGTLIDTTDYEPSRTHIISIPDFILFLEKDLFPMLLKEYYYQGLYLPYVKQPIVVLGTRYLTKSGIVNIDKMEDITNILKEKDNYIANHVTGKIYIDSREFHRLSDILSDRCSYPLLTDNFLTFVISKYLRTIYREREVIDRDILTNSTSIALYDNHYVDIDTVQDFMSVFIDRPMYSFKHVIDSYTMFMFDIIRYLEQDSYSTYRHRIINNTICIEHIPSATSRRYIINAYEERYGSVIEE